MKLWVPPYTTFVEDGNWLMKRLQNGFRTEAALITADDVLTPQVLFEVLTLNRKSVNVTGLICSSQNCTRRSLNHQLATTLHGVMFVFSE